MKEWYNKYFSVLLLVHIKPFHKTNQRVTTEVFVDDFMTYKLSSMKKEAKYTILTKSHSEVKIDHVI